MMKGIEFAESLLENSIVTLESLGKLNEELITKSVLVGGGLKPSEAVIIVSSVVHSAVTDLWILALFCTVLRVVCEFQSDFSSSDKAKLPHLLRWVDYIQRITRNILGNYSRRFYWRKSNAFPQKGEAARQTNPDKRKLPEKEPGKVRQPEKEVEKKDEELSVSLLKIQIGHICKAWKHPSADSLLVEEIDVGEVKCRQVVSGLAKYCTPDQLTNHRVVLITNVKPGKLRDVMSEGLILKYKRQTDANHTRTLRMSLGQ